MSLFEKIDEAETKKDGEEVSVRADQFLFLVDIWIMCSMLMSHIHDGEQKLASEMTMKLSALIQESGPTLDGRENV
jgi:hypothetical protein